MRKVLQVYRTYFPDTQGGAQEAIRQICLATADVAEHRIFAPSRTPDPAIVPLPEGEVHRTRLDFEIASCGFTFSGIRRFRALVRWADVIHYHYPWPFADVLNLVRSARRPTLVTYHSDIVRQRAFDALYSPLRRQFLGAADQIVATSPDYLQSSTVLQRYRDKTTVIPLGITEASYPRVTDAQLVRMRHLYGEHFFLFVGVLRYYKGLDVLLQASAGLPFRILVAGDGPMAAELAATKRRLRLDNVVLLGHIPDEDKMALLRLCRGVVFPATYRSEAFGVTLLEGAMSGRPLVTTAVGTGTSYVNAHGETGIVVPPGDADALRLAMLTLHADPQLAGRYGAAARQRFDTLFTGTAIGARYSELYRTMARRS